MKKGRKVGFPKFKSKKGKERYTTKQTNDNIKIDFERKKVKLPKLGWIRFHDNREFSQKITRATIKKTKSHRYFLSLTLEAQEDAKELQVVNEKAIIAFDMSATYFLVNDIVYYIDESRLSCSTKPQTIAHVREKTGGRESIKTSHESPSSLL